jgi:hypothetical protein
MISRFFSASSLASSQPSLDASTTRVDATAASRRRERG